MNYTLVETLHRCYIECLPGDGLLSCEQDAIDLVGACGEHGTNLVLFSEGCLAPAFYDLRSGLAGAVLLKLSTYRIRAVAVIPPELAKAGRFGEMVLETNRGSQFRVYPTRAAAETWLTGG